ncbi:hypothetical protein ABBQ38_011840 [Trebouxia sp. C0009 RCD-2024]
MAAGCGSARTTGPTRVLLTIPNRRFSPLFPDQNNLGLPWTLNPGIMGPRGAATRGLPDDAQHQALERVQPAWRDRIANLKVPKSGQQMTERELGS